MDDSDPEERWATKIVREEPNPFGENTPLRQSASPLAFWSLAGGVVLIAILIAVLLLTREFR